MKNRKYWNIGNLFELFFVTSLWEGQMNTQVFLLLLIGSGRDGVKTTFNLI